MKYLFMTISIIISVANACLLRGYSAKNKEKAYDPFLFNAGISMLWIFIMTAMFLSGGNRFVPVAVIYGAIYGVILCAFLFFKSGCMAEGPVSLSTLIGSCAFVIATWFGVFYNDESVSSFQICGMILLLASLVLCVNPKKSGEKLTVKWFLYCLGFFFAGGFVGIIYKLFGASSAKTEYDTMILTASLVSAILFLIVGIIKAKAQAGVNIKPNKRTILYMVLCGMASCIYIRMNLTLSNMIPSAIFFPVSNGGMVILSTIGGKLFFKEKLNKIQIWGIALGCVAVAITGCGDFVYSLIQR